MAIAARLMDRVPAFEEPHPWTQRRQGARRGHGTKNGQGRVKARPTLTPPPKSSTVLMLFRKTGANGVIFRAQT